MLQIYNLPEINRNSVIGIDVLFFLFIYFFLF